jgi:amino acid transporter
MAGAKVAAALFEPIPYAFWVILFAVISGAAVLFGTRLSASLTTVITLGVIGITAIYILVCFMAASKGAAPEGAAITNALKNDDASFRDVLSGASVACLSFLGVGVVTTVAPESERPKRAIGKAMAAACGIAAAMFFFQALASGAIAPDLSQFSDSDIMLEIARKAGGPPMAVLLMLAMLISCVAVGIAALTAASRMLKTLSVHLPFGKSVPESEYDEEYESEYMPGARTSPIYVFICFIAAVVVAFLVPKDDAALAMDLARFAGMLCFMLVNASALIFFWFRKNDPSYVRSLVIPTAGLLSSLWVWINIDAYAFGIGVIFALAGVIMIAAVYLYKRLMGGFPDRIWPDDEDAT